MCRHNDVTKAHRHRRRLKSFATKDGGVMESFRYGLGKAVAAVRAELGGLWGWLLSLAPMFTACFMAICMLYAGISLLWFKGWDHGNAGAVAIVDRKSVV